MAEFEQPPTTRCTHNRLMLGRGVDWNKTLQESSPPYLNEVRCDDCGLVLWTDSRPWWPAEEEI